jgi:hypothetical protein
MATTVTNKTTKPLSIPLARGKRLYLGPGRSGEIASNDAELPAVKGLVDNGMIEIVRGGAHTGTAGTDKRARPSQGYAPGSGPRRSGDR